MIHKKLLTIELISFLFILLFIYAALMKGLDAEKFKSELDQSPLLMGFSKWVVWLIPITEIITAFLLMISRTRLIGFYLAFTLMSIFTIYIIIILNFSEKIPCSCGGILETMGWKSHLVFNIAFMILGVAGVLLNVKTKHYSTLK
jgi:hypothetical protein